MVFSTTNIPSAAKAVFFGRIYGTAKAVPFQSGAIDDTT
jgi:hypothetical protein